jgi:hypothetical protein
MDYAGNMEGKMKTNHLERTTYYQNRTRELLYVPYMNGEKKLLKVMIPGDLGVSS